MTHAWKYRQKVFFPARRADSAVIFHGAGERRQSRSKHNAASRIHKSNA
jgi:hypothetical protein